MTTPGPLDVGVCLHSLDHWTAEDWQAMSRRIREGEERLREQIRQDRERMGLRVGKVQNERAGDASASHVIVEHSRSSPQPAARLDSPDFQPSCRCSSVDTSSRD